MAKKAAEVDPMAMLDDLAKDQPAPAKKGKDVTPVLHVPEDKIEIEEDGKKVKVDGPLTRAAKNLVKFRRAEKEAKSQADLQEAVILPRMKDQRKKYCTSTKKFESCVKVQIGDAQPLKIVCQNRYSKIPVTSEPQIKAAFGTDEAGVEKYKSSFTKITEISVTDAGMAEIGTLLPKLIEACGGRDKFKLYFGIEQFLKPTELYHESSATDPKMVEIATKLEGDGLVKPNKPSVQE